MKLLSALLLCLPLVALADGRHKPPKQEEPPKAKHSNSDTLVIALAAASVVGLVIYVDGERKRKKVSVAPTQDMRGATASMEWRF